MREKYNFEGSYDGTKVTNINKDIVIFPYWFFCTPENGKENYTIHHFNGSWVEPYSRKCKFSAGKYRLVIFIKRKDIEGDYLPLLDGEIKLCEISIYSTKWCVLKSK